MAPLTIAARIAPQRMAQYAALAESLARPELQLSPLADSVTEIQPLTLAGQSFLGLEMAAMPTRIPAFATFSEWYELFDEIAGEVGPFLRPIEASEPLRFNDELVEARRYRGKTNELFTHLLVNIARWSHSGEPRWLFDPLAGGGTTLFTALRLGLDGIGVEQDRAAFSSTDTFFKQYLQEARYKHRREQQKRKAGTRVLYTIPQEGRELVMAQGDTRESADLLEALPGAPRPELIVTDLPYSIQHSARGSLGRLLDEALPVWHELAAPDAILTMAWNATTFPREAMVEQMGGSGWKILSGGAYEQLAHRVDRVIKTRDVIVARRTP